MPAKTRSLEHLEQLIVAAATDRKVRDALILQAEDTAKKDADIDLDKEEVQIVGAIREDLLRFGGNPNLHPEDAKSWALGVIVNGTSRCKTKQWTVSVKSIQRNNASSNSNNKKRRGK